MEVVLLKLLPTRKSNETYIMLCIMYEILKLVYYAKKIINILIIWSD